MATGIKRKHLSTYMFLLPAVVIMGSILLYPIIRPEKLPGTLCRSFLLGEFRRYAEVLLRRCRY